MASGASKHKSFKRSYREDYARELEVPGMGFHIFYVFKLIFENWKIFLPLLIIMATITAGLVGLADGFLNGQTIIFGSLMFLMIWLSSIFVVRHRMAGNKITIFDALYNSMTPLISTLVVLVVAAIQCIPIIILVVAYSSAIETHFLETPFYALLFFTFAALLVLLSSYLLSGTLMALVAVSAPGLYPLEALKTANELMRGRKIRFILRIILLLILVVIMWVVVMFPIAKFGGNLPALIKICGIIMSCFLAIYASVYFYVYYRWMLRFDTKEDNGKKRSRKKNK
ncbi:hypothetical protein IKG07_00385 [Candidatus Saccharibacteria bacterium]|nr:hypothetical protein [Candidatus Saccharibacteria bacterium]